MLIIANKPKSGAEERVLEWLKGWVRKYKIPGVAITNAYVAGQEVDLLVITPHTTVAVEIKGTAPGVPPDGVLICTSNRRWEVPGFTGDPVLVRTKDITPYEQARDGALKLKSVVNQVGGSAYVRALVVVVPPRRSNMRLEKKSAPDGCHVLLCENHSPLRAYFHGAHSQGDIVWTADQAYALIDALESGDRTTIDELAVEGFPHQQDNPLPAAPPPGSRPVSSRPTAPVLPPPAAPRPPAPPQPDRIAGLGRRPAESAPRPVITRPSAQTSAGRRGVYQTAAAFAAIAVIGGGLWLLTSSDGDTDPQEVGNQHPLSSVVEEPAPLPAPPTAEAPPPPPAPAPAPPAGVTGCFPFQPNC